MCLVGLRNTVSLLNMHVPLFYTTYSPILLVILSSTMIKDLMHGELALSAQKNCSHVRVGLGDRHVSQNGKKNSIPFVVQIDENTTVDYWVVMAKG